MNDVLAWAACPVCNLTVSEAIPVLDGAAEDWQVMLTGAILDGLLYWTKRHKKEEHDELRILGGVCEAIEENNVPTAR